MNTHQETTEPLNSIDSSIRICQSTIRQHRLQSMLFLVLMLIIPLVAGAYYLVYGHRYQSDIKGNYVIYLIMILSFSVFTSLYRFHLKEVAKYEHFLLGFMRIRIAANNTDPGFQTEVRHSLTHDAFSYETKVPLISKSRNIENPAPGNPTTDIGTALANKIMDSIEIVQKKRSGV